MGFSSEGREYTFEVFLMKKNAINKSGKKGEDIFSSELRKNNLAYKQTKPGKEGIDFIINPNGKKEDRRWI